MAPAERTMTDVILTCSEHFTDLALNELHRHDPNVELVAQLSPQHFYLRAPGTFGNFVRPWQDQLPIYLHHLFPVHRTIPLTGTTPDFDRLRKEAQALCDCNAFVQVRVVGEYRFPKLGIVHALAPQQVATHLEKPNGRVLSLLIVENCCYMGISWVGQNISAFPTGRSLEPVPNRAGLKLLEALEVFNIQLRAGDHALDLGAAPGAWTEVLRRRGLRVTAVAPREMYDWLQTDPDVLHFPLTAEEYLPDCDTVYDLIVNDMKLDAQDSARLMVDYASHLREQGIAIMTLKLRLRNTRRLMDHAFRLLRKRYKIIRVRQLVSNRKEVTLFLRRK